ncbi:MAG: cytochrome c3 family protein [Deferrisomatales bacterium]|nr:cytochrome c3 family protein [Deferrisomatales bacterium]
MIAALLTLSLLTGASPFEVSQTSAPPLTGAHAALACESCHASGRIEDCDACHPDAVVPHPVGIVATEAVPKSILLGPEGQLLCRSCHSVHEGDPARSYLLPAGVDCSGSRRGFCFTCHPDGVAEVSPHLSLRGESRCQLCHGPGPGAVEPADERARTPRLCNFCHGVLAQGHPGDVGEALPLPRDLPRGPDGATVCSTCHDPHATVETLHYLRPVFSRHYGRGQEENPHVDSYFACRGCHTTGFADQICPPDCRLLYRDDINRMCLSCHVTERGHHPTAIPLPAPMRARWQGAALRIPLDGSGRITCYTCHDNGCATGSQAMRQRHYDPRTLKLDLCWICHEPGAFARTDPHADRPELCRWCHESEPVVGLNGGRSLVASPKMVCLRCHETDPHPAGANHLRKPTAKIHVDPGLPLGRDGEVTCITCHTPHAAPLAPQARLRERPDALCGRCHW